MLDLEQTKLDLSKDERFMLVNKAAIELIDRLQAAEAKCKMLDGISQDAIDGGWTAAGLSNYAKSLEAENAELKEIIEVLEFRIDG